MFSTEQYKHSEYVNCKEIAEFAKLFAFKDAAGNVLGRNKVFKVLRDLGILDKSNVPYQTYLKHFKTLDKEYSNGVNTYRKTIVFIKPESQKYLADKINDYLDRIEDAIRTKDKQKTKTIVTYHQSVETTKESVECSSPLDYTKEKALEWIKSLPEAMRTRSHFAIELQKKYGFEI